MTVCRFYQQGNCKFGDKCRFEHLKGNVNKFNSFGGYQPSYDTKHKCPSAYGVAVGNRFDGLSDTRRDRGANSPNSTREFFSDIVNSVCSVIEAWEKGKQWPLSCFCPISDVGNYPGLEDTSPEELRWEAYHSQQKQNNMNDYIQGVTQLYKSQESVRREIMNRSAAALEILKRLYDGEHLAQSNQNQPHVFRQSTGQSRPVDFRFNLDNNSSPRNSSSFMASNSTNATMSFQTPINSNAQVFETGNHHSGFNLLNANQMTPTFGNNSMSNSSKITFGNSSMTSSTPINQTFGQPLSTFNETQSSMSIKSNKLNDTIATSHTLVQLIYTPLDSLSEEERGLFAAPNFTLGMVPVKPPPKEYC